MCNVVKLVLNICIGWSIKMLNYYLFSVLWNTYTHLFKICVDISKWAKHFLYNLSLIINNNNNPSTCELMSICSNVSSSFINILKLLLSSLDILKIHFWMQLVTIKWWSTSEDSLSYSLILRFPGIMT